ncbi:DEKNAAC101866 [Brettanomyces naardenensis]|uniref:DEKNAAC101867 n=1 Tax=Brettanomyces naardenensis TaxID=13370 RepID=A0A448YJ31_BRENA|nr:DEKNAAC101866 [Brettanomyces naardenensis]
MTDITITIKTAGDKKHQATISTSATVGALKEQLAKDLDIPVERQRLIYSGKVLKDGDTIESYNIKDGHALHLVKGAAKPGSSATTSTANATENDSTSAAGRSSTPPSNVPSNIASGQSSFDPLAGLTSARYAGYNVPMPTLEQMGLNADGMQMPDENQIEQMMENPLFQEGMRSMLSDPQMLDYMIQQSPQLRAMGPMAREMFQSEYFRNMMTNPQALRSMMQFQRMMNQGPGAEGAGAQGSFPAPGNADSGATTTTTTTPATTTATPSTATNPSTPANASTALPPNPFSALFGNPAAANTAAGQSGNTASTGAGATPAPNPFANPNLWNMLGAMSGGTNASQPAPAPVDNRPPEEVYQSQLRQLNDMGFFDFDRNVRALRRSGGSVEGAIDELLNGAV